MNGEGAEEDEEDEDEVQYEDGDTEDEDLEIIDHDKENSNGMSEHQQQKKDVSTPKKVEESGVRNKRLNFSKVLDHHYHHQLCFCFVSVTLVHSYRGW